MSWAEQRLPGVNDVRRVVNQAFDTFDQFDVYEIVAYILTKFAREYQGLQTNIVTVADAVIVATSASPHTAGFNHHYMVIEVTPQLVAALHRAILPPCCRKVSL